MRTPYSVMRKVKKLHCLTPSPDKSCGSLIKFQVTISAVYNGQRDGNISRLTGARGSSQILSMDRSALKYYHVHDPDPKQLHERYYSAAADCNIFEELFIFPIKQLLKISGTIKGESMIDLSAGPTIFHLIAICEGFKEITILECADSCIVELEKWMKKEQDAIDLSHTSQIVAALEGNSDKWEEKEESLRGRIKHVLKCDFDKDNPTHPVVLKKADCLLSMSILNLVSKDHDTYCRNIRKMSSMLNVGGHLLLFGGFNSSFYTVGCESFHALSCDEPFVRKAVQKAGFTIIIFETLESKVRNEVVHYEHVYFIEALKVREK
uniref:Nicotinamide N-methyltransferase n=1 Tax=Leptobrachium leishanense TaxID=445787 RepID=A0A8C5R8B8_9ANUR